MCQHPLDLIFDIRESRKFEKQRILEKLSIKKNITHVIIQSRLTTATELTLITLTSLLAYCILFSEDELTVTSLIVYNLKPSPL